MVRGVASLSVVGKRDTKQITNYQKRLLFITHRGTMPKTSEAELLKELEEIDAILSRKDLSELKQSVTLARRKQVYDALYIDPQKRAQKERAKQSRKEAKLARETVLRRAENACEICFFECKFIINVHHLVSVEAGGGGNPANLIALCPNCHAIVHKIAALMRKDKNLDLSDMGYWLETFLSKKQARRISYVSLQLAGK